MIACRLVPRTRRDDARLLAVLLSARRVREYLQGVSRARFHSDTLLQDGVLRRMEVIGEAAAALSDATRESLPMTVWHQFVEVRDQLLPEYFRVDLDALWTVPTTQLPLLIDVLTAVAAPDDQAWAPTFPTRGPAAAGDAVALLSAAP